MTSTPPLSDNAPSETSGPVQLAEELAEYVADFSNLVSAFEATGSVEASLGADLKRWLGESGRDFFFTQLNRHMLLCVRYDDASDGISAWHLRVNGSVDLPPAAVA